MLFDDDRAPAKCVALTASSPMRTTERKPKSKYRHVDRRGKVYPVRPSSNVRCLEMNSLQDPSRTQAMPFGVRKPKPSSTTQGEDGATVLEQSHLNV